MGFFLCFNLVVWPKWGNLPHVPSLGVVRAQLGSLVLLSLVVVFL